MAKEVIRNWSRKYLKRIFYALSISILALIIGVVGYTIIEGYSLTDAIYMTVITLSTVGFGEVAPLSWYGKLFTIVLIVINFGVFAYAISVITSFVIDGDFKELIKLKKMTNKINNLENHIIICGYGRLGKVLCEDLNKVGKQFLVVENNHKKIELIKSKGFLYYEGDATKDETITSLSIEKASTLITTIPTDATNTFIVLAAKELNKDINVISRASEEANISKLRLAGANHVIMPEHIGGAYMAALVNGTENIDIGNWGY